MNSHKIRGLLFDANALTNKISDVLDSVINDEQANQDAVKYNQGWDDGCAALVQGLLRCLKTRGRESWVTGLDISQIHQVVRKE